MRRSSLPSSTRNRTTGLVSVVALGIILSSCKSGDTASVKTLDAIASGGITKLYQCRGSNESRINESRIIFDARSALGTEGEGTKAPLRRAVMDYFTAIDPSMQELFLKLGGNVLITDEAHISDYCRAARQNTAAGARTQDAVHGCFVFADDPTGQGTSIFTIVHAASAENIRYFGPQIFGYMYAQFYSRLGISKRQGASFSVNQTESMAFINYKEQIADAFLKDMLVSPKYNLNNLNPILGLSADAELRAFQGDSRLLDALTLRKASDGGATPSAAAKEKRRAQIRDFFFAHAFQSMNCNAEALEVTRREFPKSLEAYNQVNAALLAISSELSGVASTGGNSGDSFALAGRTGKAGKTLAAKAGGLDIASLFSMIMPLLSQLGMPGGAGGLGGLGGMGGPFSNQLYNPGMMPNGGYRPGMMPNGGYNPGTMPGGSSYLNQSNRIPYNQGLLSPSQLAQFGQKVPDLYNSLQSSGCPGGNCGGNSCSGGSCSGGECSTAGGLCEGAGCADVVTT
jgi:hypothetical protein